MKSKNVKGAEYAYESICLTLFAGNYQLDANWNSSLAEQLSEDEPTRYCNECYSTWFDSERKALGIIAH